MGAERGTELVDGSPGSGRNGPRGARDRRRTGMTRRRLRGGTGGRARDRGLGADGGSARFGLGMEAGAAAERLCSGRQGLGRGCAPPLGGLQCGRRGAQLIESRTIGGGTQGRGRGPAEPEDGGGQAEILLQGLGSPFGDAEHGLVRVEAGQQRRAEQVEDRGSGLAPDGQAAGSCPPAGNPSGPG